MDPSFEHTRNGSKGRRWQKSLLERKEVKEKAKGVDNVVITGP